MQFDPNRKSPDAEVVYLRCSHNTVERIESYASGQVNVEFDRDGHVVGVEVLSIGSAQSKALGEVFARYDLDLSALLTPKRS